MENQALSDISNVFYWQDRHLDLKKSCKMSSCTPVNACLDCHINSPSLMVLHFSTIVLSCYVNGVFNDMWLINQKHFGIFMLCN